MELRLDDWDVKYTGNRFNWLGNGYSQTEIDPTADWAFYVRDRDDDEPMSRLKKLRMINMSGTITSNTGINFSGKDGETHKKQLESRL